MYIHTYIKYMYTYIHTYIHRVYVYIHTHIHRVYAYVHARIPASTNAHQVEQPQGRSRPVAFASTETRSRAVHVEDGAIVRGLRAHLVGPTKKKILQISECPVYMSKTARSFVVSGRCLVQLTTSKTARSFVVSGRCLVQLTTSKTARSFVVSG